MKTSLSVAPRATRLTRTLGVSAAIALLLAGCSGYQLRGKVVSGDVSYVSIVSRDDARFTGPGLAGVTVRLQLDPDRLSRKTLGQIITAPDGSFEIPVDEVGAGFLMYDVSIGAKRKGYESVDHVFRLPGSGKRVLIMLAPGQGGEAWLEDDELFEQYKRFRK